MKRSFILGLGSQKCGTTTITRLLKKAGAYFPFGNEARILNNCFNPRYQLSTNQLNCKNKSSKQYILANPWQYARAFRNKSIKQGKQFVGDFTPAYCGLSIPELTYVRNILLEEDFNIKTIFIARDPFKRCWSATRHDLRRHFSSDKESTPLAHKYFAENFTSPRFLARTRYEETITNIQQSFNSEEIYIDIFERIFTGNILDNLKPLFEYLELELPTEEIDVKESNSFKLNEPTESKREFYKFYEQTYEFMYEKYPITMDLWPQKI